MSVVFVFGKLFWKRKPQKVLRFVRTGKSYVRVYFNSIQCVILSDEKYLNRMHSVRSLTMTCLHLEAQKSLKQMERVSSNFLSTQKKRNRLISARYVQTAYRKTSSGELALPSTASVPPLFSFSY